MRALDLAVMAAAPIGTVAACADEIRDEEAAGAAGLGGSAGAAGAGGGGTGGRP